MTEPQSIRDEVAEWIAGFISGNGFGDDYADDETQQGADHLLASRAIRRIQAEAWREAARFLRSPENPQRRSDFRRESYAMDDAGYQLLQRADRIEKGES